MGVDGDLLTAAETAEYCQISPNHVFSAVTVGLLPRHTFVGNMAYFSLREMEAMDRRRKLVPRDWAPKRNV